MNGESVNLEVFALINKRVYNNNNKLIERTKISSHGLIIRGLV
ncbi:MAG: hypothetical protein PHZ11_07430 [Desulfitobacteriaceae bacterium]|nr:hypothetical protein [Desulfitobacteriaceae bacterium]MDD4346701.1 hypothetical protein [Desulfitobacteriaceae bacterium]MDD4401202.1 hypothetical protein [Desulfitobacteriaceae bacterium]